MPALLPRSGPVFFGTGHRPLPPSSRPSDWYVCRIEDPGGPRQWWSHASFETRTSTTPRQSTKYPGWLQADLHMRLYEGAGCSTEDLDGEASTSFWIPPNSTVKKTFTVDSKEGLSADSIAFTFVITPNITC